MKTMRLIALVMGLSMLSINGCGSIKGCVCEETGGGHEHTAGGSTKTTTVTLETAEQEQSGEPAKVTMTIPAKMNASLCVC
jgi:hypothetical protein